MRNFIEDLYYGNIAPQERGCRSKSPINRTPVSLNQLEEQLTERLDGKNKELFIRLCNAQSEFMGECEAEIFTTGFRYGAWFVMDTFLSDTSIE